MILLNDRIPDGTDISWIWDVDFEMIPQNVNLSVSGDRVYDLALRLKYAEVECDYYENIMEAIEKSLNRLSQKETLYILPTYTAMLQVRKILVGKKIL